MEWLGFQLEQPPASPPAPSVLFLQLCCSFLAIFLPFRSACVCFFVSTFFFNGEPPRVRRIQGAQRGSTILFSFLFLFFTCFTTAVPGRTRNNKKNRCNPQKCGRNPLKRRLGGSWNRVVESTSLRWTSLTGRDLIVVVLRCSRSEWKASSRGSDWTLRRPIRVAVEYWGKKKNKWKSGETREKRTGKREEGQSDPGDSLERSTKSAAEKNPPPPTGGCCHSVAMDEPKTVLSYWSARATAPKAKKTLNK